MSRKILLSVWCFIECVFIFCREYRYLKTVFFLNMACTHTVKEDLQKELEKCGKFHTAYFLIINSVDYNSAAFSSLLY